MESKMITREEYYKTHPQTEPDWWKKTRTYEVQIRGVSGWETRMTSDVEWPEDFRIVATNQFARILKDGIDVTAKYRSADAPMTSYEDQPYGSLAAQPGPTSEPRKVTNSNTMKPGEYRALSSAEKQSIWSKIDTLLELKKKRNEIFTELKISEATYDAIRADMKSNNHVASTTTKTPQPVVNDAPKPKVDSNNVHKIQRPGLFGRR